MSSEDQSFGNGEQATKIKLEEDSSADMNGISKEPQLITTEAINPPPTLSSVSTPAGEGLEERYNKLKNFAVKLKKRIAEQNIEIETMKEEKLKFQNASKIQQEFDKAQDEIERLRKSEVTLQKDLQSAIDENVRLKMSDAEASSQIQSLSSSHKVLRDKLDKLEKESEENQGLKTKVEILEKDLLEAKDAKVDAQQEKRQLQILSLEVTDYEKKLQDAYGSLEEKKVECERLLKELNDKDIMVDELEEKILTYKDKEGKLTLAKESLQADAIRKADKIAFLQDELSKQNDRLNEKKSELLKLEQDFENAKASFSVQAKDSLEKFLSCQKVTSSLEHKIAVLEENKRSRESQITNLKLEMQQLHSDYSNYKTKAQAMLKSQKPITVIKENDELENLQRVVQDFHSEISILKSNMQTMKLENESLLMEKAELNVRMSQLKTDNIEKEVQLSNELQRVKQDLRQKEELLRNNIDAAKTEMELLSAQIETLKHDYEVQILYLREQCELSKSLSANNDLKNLKSQEMVNSIEEFSVQRDTEIIPSGFRPVIESGTSPTSESLHGVSQSAFDRVSQPITIDTSTGGLSFDQLRMIPRGEGEGSESVNSAYTPRVDHYNLSFEQLLSSSLDSASKISDSHEHDKTLREALQIELVRSQSQVNHLTSLLRESEANCDRLAQLCEALKEEIRRIERDKDRQEHLKENSEYLKNVLLKFVTLTGEAERQRLIPVLKTMLRLTSTEVEKLENVVKGKNPNQRDGQSWSSYLPMWSSTNK